MFFENLKIALTAIFANKMRSLLTVLGIMIGVAAVIAVVSIVQGMQFAISNELQQIGSTFIQIVPGAGDRRNPFLQRSPELTVEDAVAVRRGTTDVAGYSPIFITGAQMKSGGTEHTGQVLAVNTSYQEIVNHWVDQGRFFTPLDEETRKRVAVIGPNVVDDLDLGSKPVGKVIQVAELPFTVIGVLERKGGALGDDQDDRVLIPFTTATVVYGPEQMRRLVLIFQMRPGADMDLAKEQMSDILRARHRLGKGVEDDFRIVAQEEIMKTVSSVLLNVSLIMGAVVGIALIVGGIGIMNIMLVSVTERTREIGIRKSIGARRRDVMLQFLIEAIVLSGLGGVIGIAGGFGLANATRLVLKKWVDLPPVHTPLWAILVAVSFCAFLGVLFGMYPAAKASKLDPIEALRYE